MGPRKTFDYQGRKVQGQSVDFETKQESWSQYVLEDGTAMKMKVILLEVVRLDEYSKTGDPVYQFSAQYITGVQAPDELKKKVL